MKTILERLKEPSTWTALAVILALVGLAGPSEYISGNTETFVLLISAVCALFGVGMSEGKKE